MTSDRLRLAAQAMRREQSPFLDAVADLLEAEYEHVQKTNASADRAFGPDDGPDFYIAARPRFIAVADGYLNDPGDLPAAITGGAQ